MGLATILNMMRISETLGEVTPHTAVATAVVIAGAIQVPTLEVEATLVLGLVTRDRTTLRQYQVRMADREE